MTHQEKRDFLRSLRRDLALYNHIPWTFADLPCQKDCDGSCSTCRAEVQFLETELNRRAAEGKPIVLQSSGTEPEARSAAPVAEVVTPHEGVPRGDMSLEELGLSLRTRVSLDGHGITGVRQLLKLSVSDLKKVRNMTQEGLDEIEYQLGLLGHELSEE